MKVLRSILIQQYELSSVESERRSCPTHAFSTLNGRIEAANNEIDEQSKLKRYPFYVITRQARLSACLLLIVIYNLADLSVLGLQCQKGSFPLYNRRRVDPSLFQTDYRDFVNNLIRRFSFTNPPPALAGLP